MNEILILKDGHEAILTYLKENCRSKVIMDHYVANGILFEEYLTQDHSKQNIRMVTNTNTPLPFILKV